MAQPWIRKAPLVSQSGVPKISILLPYRNAQATLASALGSIFAQTFDDWELLAINDGSTDEGPALVHGLAKSDGRLRPVDAGGVGIAQALALGSRHARGEFIARMDGDDISLPTRLARQWEFFQENHRVGALGTLVEGFADGPLGAGLASYIDWQNGLHTEEDHERELFIESPLCHPSVMMPRAALEAAGGFRQTTWAEDYDLWLRIVARGYTLAKVPEQLFRWRHQAGRLTFSNPMYALERFREAKAHYLAPRLRAQGRRLAVWGAGPTGKRFARALESHGLRAAWFIDIDPAKVGRTARQAPITSLEAFEAGVGSAKKEVFVLVAVGSRGARQLIRQELVARGYDEGRDFLCVA
jgi:cellulose synthase/poly-beta-1,6-N-acetylglucosamine synthase-like glycosyltransferase